MKPVLFIILILFNTFRPISAQKNDDLSKPERVYLQTDRNIYIAGDYLFYSLYLQGTGSQLSKYAYLVIRDRHNVSLTQVRVEITNLTAFGSIYLADTLHSDIYQIKCYTNCMRNEAEDSYFTKEIVIANRFDKKLEMFDSTLYTSPSAISPEQYPIDEDSNGNLMIHLDKQVFNSREKVNFSIESKSIPADSIIRFSVSISEIVPGIPDEPSISDCFNNAYKPPVTIEPGQDHCIYHPEVKGSVVEGRVTPLPKSGNQFVTGTSNFEKDTTRYTILISTPDSIANMQYTTTDSIGSFSILLDRYYEGKELIIRLKENAKASIGPDNKFKLTRPFIPSGSFTVPGIRSYLARGINISEVQRYYTEKAEIRTIKQFKQSLSIPRIYYKSYPVVFPADYLELINFVEISTELLSGFKVRKSDNGYILSCTDTRNNNPGNQEPMIFLDGVPIDNVNQIIDLGTGQIKRIETVPVVRYYGEMLLPGILAIFSKNSEINNIQFKTPAIRYQALSSQSYTVPEPYKPGIINLHNPDIRQVLLWDPEIILRNNEKLQMECYTSDLQGYYRINIQGISSDGHPVNGTAIFTVKSKSN